MLKKIIILLLLISGWVGMFAQSEQLFYSEKEYTYSKANYPSYKRTSDYVELSDGTKLAIDLLEPWLGPFKEKTPVVLMYTPYNRSYMVPGMNPLAKMGAKAAGVGWGPEFDLGNYYPGIKALLRHGYRVVAADMRGTGASYGYQMPLEPQLAKDGKELIDWIADQPWCDGNVGMMGASYLGWGQYAVAGEKPEALKCIMPEVMGFDVYSTGIRPGGIAAQRWIRGFSDRLVGYNLNEKNLRKGLLPSLPVIDEDKDGDLVDEWPEIKRDELEKGFFKPIYKDKNQRYDSSYYRATIEHLQNYKAIDLLHPDVSYYDSRADSPFQEVSFELSSAGSKAKEISESGVAIYHVGGWYDGFAKGTPMWYSTLKETNTSFLWLAPRFHFPSVPKYIKKFSGYEGEYKEQLMVEQLRFFDRYLKGINNKFDQQDAVKAFVIHKGWQTGNDWPLEGTKWEKLFLSSDNKLTNRNAKRGKVSYNVDFEAGSNYGPNRGNRWIMYQSGTGEVMNRMEVDDKCVLFESDPLKEDKEVLGHPLVKIFLKNSQAYGDLYVYLEEVDEDGNAFYVSEGQLRGGWAQTQNYDDVALGKFDVKPDFLPWKGYKEEQWQDSIFAKNEVVELAFDLLPTGYMFRKGNKIRIALAGADWPNFELNPKLCPSNNPSKCPETKYEIICTEVYPSQIELPVYQPQSD
ncbi:MAG: CocE/NonD family hydrolase [Bacteroidota bacterium]